MKTSEDPRHRKRQQLITELFSIEFHKQPISKLAQDIVNNKAQLDKQITDAAPDFPIDKINKVDLAILRLAAFEILIKKEEPQNVVIDEAVELAKEFGNDTSPAFVNGVLGHIISYGKLT